MKPRILIFIAATVFFRGTDQRNLAISAAHALQID
jgi:hypothetical protein